MTFNDIFKKSFLEGYALADLSLQTITLCLLIACGIGVYIFVAHRLICRKSFYNKSFGIALIALPMITTAIILAVQSSVVISLGMVGALSIVRFRTAIKEPMDLVFLFWSISVGIICGAGLAAIAAILSIALSFVIWLFNSLPAPGIPVLLLVTTTDLKGEGALMDLVQQYCAGATVKSRAMVPEQMDLVIEVRKAREAELAAAVMALEGVTAATVLAHDGETTF